MQLGEVQLLWLDLKMVEANKIIEAFIKLWFVSRSGPCRIPASRDWTQIPVPRFSKLNPGIFRDCVWHINQCFPRLVLVFRQLKSLLGTPRTFQSASNVYSVDSGRVLPISVKSFLQHVGLSSCKKVYQDLFLESI